MATREAYRLDLKDKLLGIEDEGYGDFEYSDLELNTYLEMAVARLYPAVYQRASADDQTVTSYGNRGLGYVALADADRVFMVEEATELEPVTGWQIRPGRIVGISDVNETVNVYYHDAYVLPSDDVTDAGIPAMFAPLVVLGALIEALESRHDTGIRGDEQPHGFHSETQLLDRLSARYSILKEDLAMALPGVFV